MIKQNQDLVKVIEDVLVQNSLIRQRTSENSSRTEITLSELTEEIIQIYQMTLSPKYAKSHRDSAKHLIDYFGKEKIVEQISIREINAFMIYLMKKVPKGYRNYYRNYKALFNKAVELGYITENHFLKVKLPKKEDKIPVFLNKDTIIEISKKIKNPIIKKMVLFGFHTGCRRGEIVNLRWGNIDLEERVITIGDDAFTTKTKRQRKIPMSQTVYELLNEMHTDSKSSEDFVFAKPNGFPFDGDYVSRIFKRAVRKLNLNEKITFHTLRHSTASYLVQNGISLYVVKEWLGHSSVKTTEIYAHLNIDSLKKAVSLFDAA